MWWLLTLFIYWLVTFAVCYIVTEYGQNYYYDETTPAVGLKVAGGSLILAAIFAYTRPSYDTMFTAGIGATILTAIAWVAVYTFVFRFHPQHAVGPALVTMLIVSGVATMGVNSIMTPSRQVVERQYQGPSGPIRKAAPAAGPLAPSAKDKKAEAAPPKS